MMLNFRGEEEAMPQIKLDEFLDISEDEHAETVDLEDIIRMIEQEGEGNAMMTRSSVLRQSLTSASHFEFDEHGHTVAQMRSIIRNQDRNICLFCVYATCLAIFTYVVVSSHIGGPPAGRPSTHPITMMPSNSTKVVDVERPFAHKSNAIDLVCNVDFLTTKEGIDGCREACAPALCCFEQYSDHKCHTDSNVDCLLYSACKSLEYVSYSPFKFLQDAQIAIATICDSTNEQDCRDICHPSQCCFLPDYETCKQSCFTYSPCERLYDINIPTETSQEDDAPTGNPLSEIVQTQYNEDEQPMQPETTQQSYIPEHEKSQHTDPFSAQVMCDALSIKADGGMSCRHKCDSLGCCASGRCSPDQVFDCKEFDFCVEPYPAKYKYFTT